MAASRLSRSSTIFRRMFSISPANSARCFTSPLTTKEFTGRPSPQVDSEETSQNEGNRCNQRSHPDNQKPLQSVLEELETLQIRLRQVEAAKRHQHRNEIDAITPQAAPDSEEPARFPLGHSKVAVNVSLHGGKASKTGAFGRWRAWRIRYLRLKIPPVGVARKREFPQTNQRDLAGPVPLA
jgi:hypothetical protein